MSHVFVNTGQCGNQLGLTLLDSLYHHLQNEPSHRDCFFRQRKHDCYARAVCIDTEPKVVNQCVERINTSNRGWLYDVQRVVYRHGGAGNNWALGYAMCSGEFLEASLDSVRAELEKCNRPPTLVVTHSVAGGTGSGCGTRMTEAMADEFSDVTRINITVTPYHFGEVVVQHYNTVLCLAKISTSSHAVLTFENEVAHQLCREMKGIERPTLHDINHVIAANILPCLLPKYPYQPGTTPAAPGSCSGPFHTLSDDVTDLCCHPGYVFLGVKNLPQTSQRSVAFTYDSWSALTETVQAMAARGSSSERGIGAYLKLLRTGSVLDHHPRVFPQRNVHPSPSAISTTASPSSPTLVGVPGSGLTGTTHSTNANSIHSTTKESMTVGAISDSPGSQSVPDHSPLEVMRSLKSAWMLRGPDAHVGVTSMHEALVRARENHGTASHSTNHVAASHSINHGHGGVMGSPATTTATTTATATAGNLPEIPMAYTDELYYSPHTVNGYRRSISALSNSQAVLPLLQRATKHSSALFRVGAYVHQYQQHGVEEEDFVRAFRTVGQIVENYRSL